MFATRSLKDKVILWQTGFGEYRTPEYRTEYLNSFRELFVLNWAQLDNKKWYLHHILAMKKYLDKMIFAPVTFYCYNVTMSTALHTWFIISSTQWNSSKSTKASIGASLSPVSFRLVSSHSSPLLPWWSSSREILETLDFCGNRATKSWAKCRHLTEIIKERQIGLQMEIFICDKFFVFILFSKCFTGNTLLASTNFKELLTNLTLFSHSFVLLC